jgi:hypothetical protein
MLATGADRLAETTERLATNLEGKDLDQIVDEVEQFARRQTALFLGGAFALGLVAARFLKSSSGSRARSMYTSPPQSDSRPPYGSQSQVYASQSEWESPGLRSMPGGMSTQQTPSPTTGAAPGAFRPVDEPESSTSSPSVNPPRPAPSGTGGVATGGTTSGTPGGSSPGPQGSSPTAPETNPPREEPGRGYRSA